MSDILLNVDQDTAQIDIINSEVVIDLVGIEDTLVFEFCGAVLEATAGEIADNVIDEANLKIEDGLPTNDQVLTADDSKTSGFKWANAAGGAGASASLVEKTDDYPVLAGDLGVGKTLGMVAAIEKTFTLPEIVFGMVAPITLAKLGAGKLNITAHAGQNVGFGDAGGSIYNDTTLLYCSVTLQPVFSITRWILINMTGTWRK